MNVGKDTLITYFALALLKKRKISFEKHLADIKPKFILNWISHLVFWEDINPKYINKIIPSLAK
jgi:hypothetical protein